jgi:hypothetical protein
MVTVTKCKTTVKTKTTKANRRQNPKQAVYACVYQQWDVRFGYYHEPAVVQMLMCFASTALTLLKAAGVCASAKPFFPSLCLTVSIVQSKVLRLIAKVTVGRILTGCVNY